MSCSNKNTEAFQSPATLVGRAAPTFTAAAVLGSGEIQESASLSDLLQGRYGVLVFYPLDFTFVCPTELVALDQKLDEFKLRNAEVLAISVDSHFSHSAWRALPIAQGGIGSVGYTMVSDLSQEICAAYGVKAVDASVALRATFIIDQSGIVQAQIVNNLPLGRNIDEFIRVLDALQFYEEHGEVCPANWSKGDTGLKTTQAAVGEYLTEVIEN